MRFNYMLVAAFATATLAAPLAAHATETFQLDALGLDLNVNAILTLADAFDTNGYHELMGISGLDTITGGGGDTITGISNYAGADNLVNPSGVPDLVDFSGISFTVVNPAVGAINIYDNGGQLYYGLLQGQNPGGAPDGLHPFTSVTLTGAGGVPEPATWALMIIGFGGAGAMLRKRRSSLLTA